jgi:hypothetical protein
MRPHVSPTRQLERQLAAEDTRRSRLFDSPSEPGGGDSPADKQLSAPRHRQSLLDGLTGVELSAFADASGRLSPPVSLEDRGDGGGSSSSPFQTPAPAPPSVSGTTGSGSSSRRRAERAAKRRNQLYEHPGSDPRSILHGSSLGHCGTLRTRLRRPKRLDPYHDPIPRTAPSMDARAISPSRNLGLVGKSRSQPRFATQSPKRYGSRHNRVPVAAHPRGGSGTGPQWNGGTHSTGAHGSAAAAADRPRAVARGNMTLCLTRPSPLGRSLSSPVLRSADHSSPVESTAIADLKEMLQSATWADERPSALEWKAEPELGEPGLPHLRRGLKTAAGFESRRYVLARASIA